jgi:hypothetical protein
VCSSVIARLIDDKIYKSVNGDLFPEGHDREATIGWVVRKLLEFPQAEKIRLSESFFKAITSNKKDAQQFCRLLKAGSVTTVS